MELNKSLPEYPLTINRPPTLWQIANEVAYKHGLTIALLRNRIRTDKVVAARWEYFYRAAAETPYTKRHIARVLLVDRTTVAYGVTRYAVQHNLPLPKGHNWRSIAVKVSAQRGYPNFNSNA
jgi:hypothetical protein